MKYTMRQALEIVQRMIAGEPIEASIVSIATMESLGNVVRDALAIPTDVPASPGKASYIRLRPTEIQSGLDRVRWAEGLIRQLPLHHDGRNSWLANYAGEKHEADRIGSPPEALETKDAIARLKNRIDSALNDHLCGMKEGYDDSICGFNEAWDIVREKFKGQDGRDPAATDPLLEITYTNYKGETSVRRIAPQSIRFGSTEWHPRPQWLLRAYDVDKNAHREFALGDFGNKSNHLLKEANESVARLADRITLLISELFDLKDTLGTTELGRGFIKDHPEIFGVEPTPSALKDGVYHMIPSDQIEAIDRLRFALGAATISCSGNVVTIQCGVSDVKEAIFAGLEAIAISDVSERAADDGNQETAPEEYLRRDEVRKILRQQPDENLDITEAVLADIDELPVLTAQMICGLMETMQPDAVNKSAEANISPEKLAEFIHNYDRHLAKYIATNLLHHFSIKPKSKLAIASFPPAVVSAVDASAEATHNVGRWLSAALDDPAVCAEMKADIIAWMDAGKPNVQPTDESAEARLREGLVAAIRAAKLAIFTIRKQGVMPNSSWESGFSSDLKKAEQALSADGDGGGFCLMTETTQIKPSSPSADRREIVARIKADPGDGTVAPDIAHVLARGFEAMGWLRPQDAAEDTIDAILAALEKSTAQPHDWIKSTLGHGESMCSRCMITNREAAVLGRMNHCQPIPRRMP